MMSFASRIVASRITRFGENPHAVVLDARLWTFRDKDDARVGRYVGRRPRTADRIGFVRYALQLLRPQPPKRLPRLRGNLGREVKYVGAERLVRELRAKCERDFKRVVGTQFVRQHARTEPVEASVDLNDLTRKDARGRQVLRADQAFTRLDGRPIA